MDDHLSKLQLWEAEKNMLLFFNELNTYYDLIKSDLDDYDMEDMEILAMDIDNALTALSGYFCIGLTEEPGTITSDQVEAYFKKIHDHIIENEDIAFATDIVESDPHFTPVQDFLVKYMRDTKKPFRSITLIDIIKEQVYDIIAWAELWHVHHARDIHDELSNRSNTAIKIGATHAPAKTALTTPMKKAKSQGIIDDFFLASPPRDFERSIKNTPESARPNRINRIAIPALNQGFP